MLAVCAALGACGSQSYQPVEMSSSSFLQRSVTQVSGPITVEAAVPSGPETQALVGLDLYDQGIQPIWIKVTNNGEVGARVAHWSIDRHYFPPIEVAYMNRKPYSKKGYEAMERWFYENALPRRIPPGESRSGLVYTRLKKGTKGFNFDIFSQRKAYNFTFFIPMPGFEPDYIDVKFDSLYSPEALVKTDVPGFKALLEDPSTPTHPENADGEGLGAPLNIVLVGSRKALRRSLLRGTWIETTEKDEHTIMARQQRLWDRGPDGIFYLARKDSREIIELRLWLSPWQVEGEPVWLGQVAFGLDDRRKLAQFLNPDSMAADLDSPQRFAMQIFWYSQSLSRVGYVEGIPPASREDPGTTFYGREYFTDGLRLVIFLTEEPTSMTDGRIVYGKNLVRQAISGTQ